MRRGVEGICGIRGERVFSLMRLGIILRSMIDRDTYELAWLRVAK